MTKFCVVYGTWTTTANFSYKVSFGTERRRCILAYRADLCNREFCSTIAPLVKAFVWRHSRCGCNRRFLKPPDVYTDNWFKPQRSQISKRSDAWVKRFVRFINIVHAYANWIWLRGSPSYVITLFRLHHFEVLPALYGHSGTDLAALSRNHECWWWGQLRNMTSSKRQLLLAGVDKIRAQLTRKP